MKIANKAMILAATLLSTTALADRNALYEVTVTNLTPGQTFTPILVALHDPRQSLFTPGDPASEALGILAEEGDTAPLTEALENAGVPALQITTIFGPDPSTPPPLTGPGQSASIEVSGPRRRGRLSIAAMLIPTNDTFVSLNSVELPRFGQRTYIALAYDAGTEANDQNCANIPGPRCGGEGVSAPADSDEGFVHVSNGFHELGSADDLGNEILGPMTYDWHNPVAEVTVRRIR